MVLSFQPVERSPPTAQVQIKVKHPRSVLASPARAVLSAMHARLVNLVLEEPSDAFQMCGISYSVASASDGLSVSFSGFNEHLAQLQQLVLPKLREPQVKSSDFEMIRRQMMLELQDVTSQQPYQHALEALELVSVTQTHSRKAMLQAVQDVWAVSLTEHQAMLDEILAAPQLLVLVSGNLAPRPPSPPKHCRSSACHDTAASLGPWQDSGIAFTASSLAVLRALERMVPGPWC